MRKKTLLILLGLLSLVGWFYWFQWKPSDIRKSCAEEATGKYEGFGTEQKAKKSLIDKYYPVGKKPQSLYERLLTEDSTPKSVEENPTLSTRANNYYRICLSKHGMKPESLFVNLQ